MRIEIIVFEGFDPLDVVAPWEVFVRAATLDPSLDVALVRTGGGNPVTGAYGMPIHVAEELGSPDAVFVPGGGWVAAADTGVPHEIRAGELPRAIARLSETARWVASVCTGALLLGEAGLLQGRNATTNPAALGELSKYGATVRQNRVVDDGAVVTAGAVTAGLDLALWLVQRELGGDTARMVARAIAYPMPSDVWRCAD
ncbi:DJ-1/PfpI family protein [Mycobacterium sp. E740]|uniref:DJ-1/PfpI family protein n=1 Tax=Mycobacterium sp. E740 TaxID=1834149 RepID=UPI0007FE894E|nr:DJ-1/PfpI family protein [Mycobacterium sp. E740]OBI74406.1 thiamine biosynthesis protein ThiJ [Mycobacterium sp. E740]